MKDDTKNGDAKSPRDEHIEKLGSLIEGVKIAMLTTMDENGVHRSRPMATQQVEFDGDLWFFTSKNSPKVVEIKDESNVNVSFSNPDKDIYVSVSGTASVLVDKDKIKELWTPAYKAWFPDGVDDENIGLIKVHAEQAEYWDTPSSPVVHLIGFVKATVTGQSYQPGENEKIDLEHDSTTA